jgi:hypothetical protein
MKPLRSWYVYLINVYWQIEYSLLKVLKKFFRIRKETRDIENAMLVAISHVTHRLPRVRTFARLVIKNVLDKFPGIIWNNELFTYLLKQLQMAVDSPQEMAFHVSSTDIVDLANSWVSLACKVSPGHIFTMIQVKTDCIYHKLC